MASTGRRPPSPFAPWPDIPRAYEGRLAVLCPGHGPFTTRLPALRATNFGGRYAWGQPLVGNGNTIPALGGAAAEGPAT